MAPASVTRVGSPPQSLPQAELESCKPFSFKVKSWSLAPTSALCLRVGPVLLKLGEIQRRTPMASWEREKRL